MLIKNSFVLVRNKPQALSSLCLCKTVSPGLLGLLPYVMRTCRSAEALCQVSLVMMWSFSRDVSKGLENTGTDWKPRSQNCKYLTDHWRVATLRDGKRLPEMKQKLNNRWGKTQNHNWWARQGICCSLGKYSLQVSQSPRSQKSRTKSSLKTAIFYTRWKSWTWRRGKEDILFMLTSLIEELLSLSTAVTETLKDCNHRCWIPGIGSGILDIVC